MPVGRLAPGSARAVSSRQPWYGSLWPTGVVTPYAPEPWIRLQAMRGQINPTYQERERMVHGRYLSGFGTYNENQDDAKWSRGHQAMLTDMAREDDSYGSGIFDPPGSSPTANANTGIFESDYALPGYIGREVPYAVSRDVVDVQDLGPMVYIPAGGLYAHAEPTGPTPRGPEMMPTPTACTGLTHTYAAQYTGDMLPPANQAIPPRDPYFRNAGWPDSAHERPLEIAIGATDPVQACMAQGGQWNLDTNQCDLPAGKPGWGKLLFAGALLGVGIALVTQSSGKKKKGSQR